LSNERKTHKKAPVNVEVINHGRDSFKVIRRFMKKVKNEGLMQELRDRRYYEKPSEKRRKRKLRRIKVLKKLRKETEKNAG
jgi:small subunit ribosomal protein S21